MKRFHFALDRVLALRRAQAQVEEAALNRIQTELHQLDAQCASLTLDLRNAETEIRSQTNLTSQHLTSLDAFREHVRQQNTQLAAARLELVKRQSAQTEVLMRKRLEIMLLEKLRGRKHREWTAETERELTNQAEEFHLVRWQKLQ
jgi:flagellar protein FliJ